MGLWARVLTAGAAVLVASPAFAHCHFSGSDCYTLVADFGTAWNTTVAADRGGPFAQWARSPHGADPRVVPAALTETPAERRAPRKTLADLFAAGGRLIDVKGGAWSFGTLRGNDFKSAFHGTTYTITDDSVRVTDLGERYVVAEWHATVGPQAAKTAAVEGAKHAFDPKKEAVPHRVVALLARMDAPPAKGRAKDAKPSPPVWRFSSVVMIPDEAESGTGHAAPQAK